MIYRACPNYCANHMEHCVSQIMRTSVMQTAAIPINVDETGSNTTGTVLSNVATDGTAKSTSDHCGGFTNSVGTFTVGKNANADFQWTDYSPVANCTRPTAYLFCFEQ